MSENRFGYIVNIFILPIYLYRKSFISQIRVSSHTRIQLLFSWNLSCFLTTDKKSTNQFYSSSKITLLLLTWSIRLVGPTGGIPVTSLSFRFIASYGRGLGEGQGYSSFPSSLFLPTAERFRRRMCRDHAWSYPSSRWWPREGSIHARGHIHVRTWYTYT